MRPTQDSRSHNPALDLRLAGWPSIDVQYDHTSDKFQISLFSVLTISLRG